MRYMSQQKQKHQVWISPHKKKERIDNFEQYEKIEYSFYQKPNASRSGQSSHLFSGKKSHQLSVMNPMSEMVQSNEEEEYNEFDRENEIVSVGRESNQCNEHRKQNQQKKQGKWEEIKSKNKNSDNKDNLDDLDNIENSPTKFRIVRVDQIKIQYSTPEKAPYESYQQSNHLPLLTKNENDIQNNPFPLPFRCKIEPTPERNNTPKPQPSISIRKLSSLEPSEQDRSRSPSTEVNLYSRPLSVRSQIAQAARQKVDTLESGGGQDMSNYVDEQLGNRVVAQDYGQSGTTERERSPSPTNIILDFTLTTQQNPTPQRSLSSERPSRCSTVSHKSQISKKMNLTSVVNDANEALEENSTLKGSNVERQPELRTTPDKRGLMELLKSTTERMKHMQLAEQKDEELLPGNVKENFENKRMRKGNEELEKSNGEDSSLYVLKQEDASLTTMQYSNGDFEGVGYVLPHEYRQQLNAKYQLQEQRRNAREDEHEESNQVEKDKSNEKVNLHTRPINYDTGNELSSRIMEKQDSYYRRKLDFGGIPVTHNHSPNSNFFSQQHRDNNMYQNENSNLQEPQYSYYSEHLNSLRHQEGNSESETTNKDTSNPTFGLGIIPEDDRDQLSSANYLSSTSKNQYRMNSMNTLSSKSKGNAKKSVQSAKFHQVSMNSVQKSDQFPKTESKGPKEMDVEIQQLDSSISENMEKLSQENSEKQSTKNEAMQSQDSIFARVVQSHETQDIKSFLKFVKDEGKGGNLEVKPLQEEASLASQSSGDGFLRRISPLKFQHDLNLEELGLKVNQKNHDFESLHERCDSDEDVAINVNNKDEGNE